MFAGLTQFDLDSPDTRATRSANRQTQRVHLIKILNEITLIANWFYPVNLELLPLQIRISYLQINL